MGEREREERQLESLPTAGNQFPVTESLLESNEEEEGSRRRRKENSFSVQESKGGGKIRCQPVCLRRLACSRGQETVSTGSRGEEVAAMCMEGW